MPPFVYLIVTQKINDSIFYRYACSLLRQDMKKIVITLDSPDILSLEKQGDKEALAKVTTLNSYTFKIFSHLA